MSCFQLINYFNHPPDEWLNLVTQNNFQNELAQPLLRQGKIVEVEVCKEFRYSEVALISSPLSLGFRFVPRLPLIERTKEK